VNEWLIASTALLVLLLLAGLLAMRGALLERLVAMQLASTIGVIALVLLAQGFERDVYFDIAVVTAAMSFVGTLFYVRAFEEWLEPHDPGDGRPDG
jgi:multicomponent Na+:H+ antiporter subunit F